MAGSPGGEVLDVGRRARRVPAPLLRALRRRDASTCRFPGCSHRRWLHAHHVRHWADGGPTRLDNLVLLCSFHHTLVHEGGFELRWTRPGDVEVRDPRGRVLPRVPALSASVAAPRRSSPTARGPAASAPHRPASITAARQPSRPPTAVGACASAGACWALAPPLYDGDRIDHEAVVDGMLLAKVGA